ncbi:stage II sporulation protein M, partial [PVC group bacterium]|nr:stage II sporulation protein M [PVC group bacterium]
SGWRSILMNNVRALGLATLFGAFSFGILAELLLMAPITIIGYLAGNLDLAGQNTMLYMSALVLPHAIIEIPAAIIAGGAILRLGMVFISPPRGSSLGESWVKAFADWGRISL